MSFKQQVKRVGESEWLLENGVPFPITAFMNQKLFDESEEGMWQQAVWATTIPSVEKIVITPDAHIGAGVPVGIVIATKDHIAPCAAGFDISCGMISLKTKLTFEDIKDREKRRAWMKSVESRIAIGMGSHQMLKQTSINSKKFEEILQRGLLAFHTKNTLKDKFEKTHHRVDNYVYYEKAFKRGSKQLCSLGSGNHFLELQQDENKNIWIMIHTGSRGYGHQIATDFFNEGFEWYNKNHHKPLQKQQKELINFPVDSDIGRRYLSAMNQAANFAIVNRYLISVAVSEATQEIFQVDPDIVYEISHNLVQFEDGLWIHRKGATRALPAGHSLLQGTCFEASGHPILIPGSMGTASAILTPFESQKSLYSINHGCGRVMGRKDAKRRSMGSDEQKSKIISEGKYLIPTQAELNIEMDELDILYNTRNVPIDECLHCYKDIDEVLKTVEEAKLATVKVKLFPIAVIKGND